MNYAIKYISFSEKRAEAQADKDPRYGITFWDVDITINELKQALFDADMKAFMESNIDEAQVQGLIDILKCSREHAVKILGENNASA
jgi:hypothetical protein